MRFTHFPSTTSFHHSDLVHTISVHIQRLVVSTVLSVTSTCVVVRSGSAMVVQLLQERQRKHMQKHRRAVATVRAGGEPPGRCRWRFVAIGPEHEEYLQEITPPDANAAARARAVHYFEMLVNHHARPPHELLRGFYAVMRVSLRYSALTARTYLGYVITELKIPPHRAKSARRLANRQAAIEAPVRSVSISPTDKLLGALSLCSGEVRRALALILVTGARAKDVSQIQADELIAIRNADTDQVTVEIAWSETKTRKDYSARQVIKYPAALTQGELGEVLLECFKLGMAPCPNVTASDINKVLRRVGLRDTTKCLRIDMFRRTKKHLEDTSSGEKLSKYTGHFGDGTLDSTYMVTEFKHRHRELQSDREAASSAGGEQDDV